MSANNDTDGLFDAIQELIVDVLGVEPEEVVPAARWEEDLGGESIDLLDLAYRCEKRWGVRVNFSEMIDPDALATDETGTLTAESLAALRARYPELCYEDFEKNPSTHRMLSLVTVGAIERFVREAIQQKAATIR